MKLKVIVGEFYGILDKQINTYMNQVFFAQQLL
jgi:hypothetical protein